jgi:RimJ/RimL family protein N-acetyltransferase
LRELTRATVEQVVESDLRAADRNNIGNWAPHIPAPVCAAALEYLWRSTEYQRVYARTDPPNSKSVQVMVRLGMTHESTTASMISYLLRRPV